MARSARPHSIRTRGLVLRRVSYSDTSQIITAFTRDEGVVSLLAKGSLRLARKSSSFPAPFDLCGWYDLVYRHRDGELHLATEARLVEGFDHLRHDVACYVDACLALEVMLRVFQPADPHPHFLRGALSYFKLLGVDRGRRQLRVHFHSQVMRAGGMAPQWGLCPECGNEVGEGVAGFRPPFGVVCESCRHGGDETLASDLVRYLDREAAIPWGRVPSLDAPPELLGEAWKLVRRLLLYHLERPPRSLQFVRE